MEEGKDCGFDPDLLETFQAVKADPAIGKALSLVRDRLPETISVQKELALIEAPTGHEEKKGARYAELLREAGLEGVETDPHGSVFGFLKGTGNTGKSVLIEGHLDTVFSFGDVKGVTEDSEGRLHCPGICDDTRALAANLAVLRAMKQCGIRPFHDIIFAATVQEEGLGGMNGMKWLLEELDGKRTKILATISIDGGTAGTFYANATGMADYRISFDGPGGHAWTAFGIPSAVQAAARAAALAADIELPKDPKTILTVSLIKGGQAVHAIAEHAEFMVNTRSNSAEALEKVNEELLQACRKGAELENQRWGKPGVIQVSWEKLLDIPAGSQPESSRIVQAAKVASKLAGAEPVLKKGGCTNGNISIGRGIPAVTLSRGGEEFGQHTLSEWFNPKGVWVCEQRSILILAALAGIPGVKPLGDTLKG
ncbi:MAG: M20/M25/M40 family metallo-hydrolase [Sutterellaceae bacterium]|nr:M20/M25/M40 family metallo-hydrolase [Sutterellaceae bacterium]MDD7441559.1 M20/M25/M40 family metallo-hydrolase [Sutterellaceae bacterium]MDY2868652.1 M20/M25/M40 family metallo-hydrolase [Mesosutterella sp.]